MILEYKFSKSKCLNNRFEYVSMKPNRFFNLFKVIVVEKSDIKYVQQKLLEENDWAWKTIVYGFSGDIDVVLNLKSYNSLKVFIEAQKPSLISGNGVKYNTGDEKDATHLLGKKMLNSKTAFNHFSLNETQTFIFSKSKIDRPRENPLLFEAPYCLVKSGLDMSDFTMRAVYSESDFVFNETILAIKGIIEQKNILLNITGLVNSSLYAYLNLMLGSSAGIEREKRQVGEVLDFPFILNNSIVEQVEQIQKLKNPQDEFEAKSESVDEIEILNKMILEAFGLSDNEFVDYALKIQIPQLTRTKDEDVYRSAIANDLKIYGKCFYDYFSKKFSRKNKYIQIYIYPNIAKYYSAVEIVIVDKKPTNKYEIVIDCTNKQKEMFANFSAHKINEQFYSLKDVLYFEENSFYFIKPNFYKNWHPAIAKLDLLEVIDQILSGNGGNE
jgi:hypothetical protein